jgi:hypothetical protein
VEDPDSLVPRNKRDLERAAAAVSAGYPAIAPVMGDLLKWLQDGNWPVAHVLAPFLRDLGPITPTVDDLRTILEGDDDIWKYWVLCGVIDGWEDTALIALELQLERLAQHPSANELAEGVDEIAGQLLTRLRRSG